MRERYSHGNPPHVLSTNLTDHWILLHLDTLLPPQPYLPLEDVKKLEWSDTPEKEHIARARLNLYDYLATTEHEGAKRLKPDPELLRVFLWSKDRGICRRAFSWCLNLVTISQSGTPGDTDSTRIFIPVSMGYEWVMHFIHVLCKGEYQGRAALWDFLISDLVPKWAMLLPSWCHDFASALLFTVVHPLDAGGRPAYQLFAESHESMSFDGQRELLPFLATLLELIKSSLTWDRIVSLDNWLTELPESFGTQDAHTRIGGIMAMRKQRLQQENSDFLAQLPMAGEWLEETLELFTELPMANEWMDG